MARPGSLTNMAAARKRQTKGQREYQPGSILRKVAANEILLGRIQHGRIMTAEGYKAMNMPL